MQSNDYQFKFSDYTRRNLVFIDLKNPTKFYKIIPKGREILYYRRDYPKMKFIVNLDVLGITFGSFD